MRRLIILIVCTAFILAVWCGCFVVTAVATAVIGAIVKGLTEIGTAISMIVFIFAIPVLVTLAWVLFAADWFTFVELIRLLLGLLGLS